jgi:hypothetical protein
MWLFKLLERQPIECEIEEELRFHVELLTAENLQQEMSLADARDAALKRFGDVEQIKGQCVEISRRRQPLIRVLRAFLIPVFLSGVLVRVFSSETNLLHLGDLLIFVAVLGRLLLYVRTLNPVMFRARRETLSPLVLIDRPDAAAAYDQQTLTPVERVIADR